MDVEKAETSEAWMAAPMAPVTAPAHWAKQNSYPEVGRKLIVGTMEGSSVGEGDGTSVGASLGVMVGTGDGYVDG
jgi:hypothetical protein